MSIVSMGIPGIGDVPAGTHLCALYSGPEERDEILFPFLEEGLRHGDKCVCLVDEAEPESIRDRAVSLPDKGFLWRTDQLEVDRASDVYLESGRFSVDPMTSFLAESLVLAAQDGVPLLRVAGEMSWVLPRPRGAEDFFVYESAVTEVVEDQQAVFMCLYDIHRFGVSMLIDVLRTHPTVLLASTVLDNPHYLTPADYPVDATVDLGVDALPLTMPDLWGSLTEAELHIAPLVANGMTNRNVAEHLCVSPHTIDAHLKHIFSKLDIHSRVELSVLAIRHGLSGA